MASSNNCIDETTVSTQGLAFANAEESNTTVQLLDQALEQAYEEGNLEFITDGVTQTIDETLYNREEDDLTTPELVTPSTTENVESPVLYQTTPAETIQGTQGAQGTSGLTGPSGPAGSSGDAGPQGIQGSAGTGTSIWTSANNGNLKLTSQLNFINTSSVTVAVSNNASGMTNVYFYASGGGGGGGGGGPGLQGVDGAQGAQGSDNGPQGPQGPTGLGAQGITGIQGDLGLQGTQGETGSQGIQGIQGDQGAQGETGIQGTQGAFGLQGAQGIQGFEGAQGLDGVQGAEGDQGLQGSEGPQGAQGETGIQGDFGVQGADGLQGQTGPQGVQGEVGIQGDFGAQGLDGIQGSQGVQGETGAQGVQGEVGTQGVDGVQGSQGVQGEVGAQGVQGEVGTQGAGGTQGSQGVQGEIGVQGVQGETGTQGTQGIQGEFGTQGVQGTTGTQGTQGETGAQGTQGVQGELGVQGTQGTDGTQGSQGTIGSQGTQGIVGEQGEFGGASFDYIYTTNTANTNPGNGYVAFDNTNWPSVTRLYISQLDSASVNVANYLETIDDSTSTIKGTFKVANTANVTLEFAFFNINGFNAYQNNYFSVPTAYLNGITDLPDSTNVVITFVRTGDKGDTGLQGSTGTQGTQGTQGVFGTQGTQGVQGETGTQGTQGETGTQGTQGVQGTQGSQGVDGTLGATGAQGAQGTQGTTGNQGTQGTFGTQGTQGIQGVNGTQGTQGVQGEVGNQGTIGSQGIQGETGTQGTGGVQGSDGVQGSYGLQGSQGEVGSQGVQGDVGTQGIAGLGFQGAVGTQGPQGSDGTQGSQGVGTQGETGAQGIQGRQGVQGAFGNQGVAGTNGNQGTIGPQGTAGLNGTPGSQGSQGAQGTFGSQGTVGTAGVQGSQGTQGVQGIQGVQGETGVQGTQGVQGLQGAGISTTGTTDNVAKFATTTSIGNSIVVSKGGTVGVGTLDPNTRLHIFESNLASTNVADVLKIETNRADFTGIGGSAIVFKNQDSNNLTNEGRIKVVTENDGSLGVNNEATSSFIFSLTENGVDGDKVIFRGDGNVGVGTLTPGAKIDAAGSIRASQQLISTVATGTAPLQVVSSTLVANLNADLLDGYTTSTTADASTVAVRNAQASLLANQFSGTTVAVTGAITGGSLAVTGAGQFGTNVTASRLISNVAVGTAPLIVISNTVVANLNAESVGGNNMTQLDARYVNVTGDTMTGTLNMHAGGAEGHITFGSDSATSSGIRKHDDGEQELYIYSKDALSQITIATGYDASGANPSKPTDGVTVSLNRLGVGDFSTDEPLYKIHAKGDIYANGGYFRVSNSNGILWETWGQRILAADNQYLRIRANNGILFTDTAQNAKGYLYWDNTTPETNFGLLNRLGSWAFRSNTTESEIYGTLYFGDSYGNIMYDRNATAYYVNPAGSSVFNHLALGTAASDTTNLKLDVQGNMTVRGSNRLYFGVTTNNFNSWTTALYASGSTQHFNAQEFRFTNEGYGSTTYTIINSDYLSHYSDIRTPIFYDSDDTNYYVDANTRAHLYRVTTPDNTGTSLGWDYRNVLRIWDGGTSGYFRINTNLPWTNHMPTIKIRGYRYGTGVPFEITIVYYIYADNYTSYGYTCSPGFPAPSLVRLGRHSGNKVAIEFANDGVYYSWYYVDVKEDMATDQSHYTGWTYTAAQFDGTYDKIVTVNRTTNLSDQVTINYSNDTNSTYQVLWGSGNSIYGTAGIYVNPSSDYLYASRFVDGDSTGFYADPASTSLFAGLNVYSGSSTGELNVGRSSSQRFNQYVTDGIGYFRYYQDESDGTNHSVSFEIQSPSSGTNRFYFNRPVEVTGDVHGNRFVDSDNTGFYVNPAGNLSVFQGEIQIQNSGGYGTTHLNYSLGGGSYYWRGITYFDAAAVYAYDNLRFDYAQNQDNSSYYIEADSTTRLLGLLVGGVNNGTAVFFRDTNPWTIGNTDAVLTVSDRSNADWGIRIDKAGYDYGLLIETSTSGSYGIYLNSGRFRVYGDGTVDGLIFRDYENTGYYVNPANDLAVYVYGEICNSNYAQGNLQPGALNIGRNDTNYRWDGTSWASDVRLGILANCADYWEFGVHDSGTRVASPFYYDGGSHRLLMGRDIGWGTMYIEAASSFRAPIFYDSNDTAWYLDPNSISKLNSVQPYNLGGAVLNRITSNIGISGSGVNEAIGFIDGTTVQAHTSTGNGNPGACYNWYTTEWIWVDPEKDYEFSYWVRSTGNDNIYFGWHELDGSGNYISSNPYFTGSPMNTNGTWVKRVALLRGWRHPSSQANSNGTDRFASQTSRNTTFDCTDGVMHSNTTRIHLRFGTCYGSVSGSKTYFHLASIREVTGHDRQSINYMVPYFNGSSWQGSMNFRSRTHWDNVSGIDIIGGAGEFRMSSDSGNLNLRVDGWIIGYDYVQSLGGMYATIYYDQNDSSYYCDPNGTSNLSQGFFWGNRLVIRGGSPTLYFRDTDENSAMLHNNSNRLYVLRGGADSESWSTVNGYWPQYWQLNTNYTLLGGVTETITDFRGPVFYDSDTSYYFNGDNAGLDAGRIRGAWTHGPNATWGTYIRFGGNGDAGDWAQVMTTNGNLHLDPRRGGYATYLNWYAGYPVYVENEIQATIFYDRNDPTYYGNFNSLTNWQGLQTRAKAQIGLTGQDRSSAQYYAQRPNITSDRDYWTGSHGWSTVDMNTVADWGSGFFDSWSNPGNQPAGTSHWVGVQSYHYTNGSARYGWQLAGGPISGAWWRNTWSGFSGWRKIAMYGLNEYSDSFWSTIMYDSNDGGYYIDPNGSSRLNRIDTNDSYTYGWHRNHNSGQGLYNQSTGMHWYTTNGYWRSAGGGYGYGGILMYNNYESDLRGYCGYYDGSGFGMLNSSGNWQIRIEYGNANMELYRVTFGNDFRAYIYYDRDNTGYYFGGGQGEAQLAAAYSNNWFRPQGCVGLYFQSYGRGIWSPECEGNPYGHIATYGGGRNGWYGYGAGSRWTLMTTVGDNFGLHDNSRGNWLWYWDGSYTRWNYGYNYFSGDVRSWRFYDHDTSYYGDFNDWSRMWGIGTFYLRNNYSVDVDHPFGVAFANDQSTAYRFYRESGGWSYPYPDVRIAFHTGIKMGANGPSYEGLRIYSDYDMSGLLIQLNGSSSYSFWYTWQNLTGYHGLYSGINGAHFYPNDASYGSWRIQGSRNGWGGIQFDSGICLMMNYSEHGFYSTAFGWRLYLNGSVYSPGNVVAYWSDRRLKENIKELDRGEGLDKIMKLKPSRFNWRKEAEQVTNGIIVGGTEEVSVIAQEAQEVLPNAVVINKTAKKGVEIDGEVLNDYYTVNYDKITPFLIQAIKDLKKELDELKEKLQKERNRNGTN